MEQNEIISYLDMCQREGASLQRGMSFGLGGHYSVILMSVHKNAPYQDMVSPDGVTLIYEGHDVPKTKDIPNPKVYDQQASTANGCPTENGKFISAVELYKAGQRRAELVRVYEKIRPGIWSYNGVFSLIDHNISSINGRNVFKFTLRLNPIVDPPHKTKSLRDPLRIIPTHVKVEVWQRDKGKCTICGATDELHFDHIVPFSKGGSSNVAENIQLLCARHNLAKRDKII